MATINNSNNQNNNSNNNNNNTTTNINNNNNNTMLTTSSGSCSISPTLSSPSTTSSQTTSSSASVSGATTSVLNGVGVGIGINVGGIVGGANTNTGTGTGISTSNSLGIGMNGGNNSISSSITSSSLAAQLLNIMDGTLQLNCSDHSKFNQHFSAITDYFDSMNYCEKAVVMYALIKRMRYQDLKFLQHTIESNLNGGNSNSTQSSLHSFVDDINANSVSYLKDLMTFYKNADILHMNSNIKNTTTTTTSIQATTAGTTATTSTPTPTLTPTSTATSTTSVVGTTNDLIDLSTSNVVGSMTIGSQMQANIGNNQASSASNSSLSSISDKGSGGLQSCYGGYDFRSSTNSDEMLTTSNNINSSNNNHSNNNTSKYCFDKQKKESILYDFLNLLPMLKPGNDEAKQVYMQFVPLIVNDAFQNQVPKDLVKYYIIYMLIHPATNIEDGNTLASWLRHLDALLQAGTQQNSCNELFLQTSHTNPTLNLLAEHTTNPTNTALLSSGSSNASNSSSSTTNLNINTNMNTNLNSSNVLILAGNGHGHTQTHGNGNISSSPFNCPGISILTSVSNANTNLNTNTNAITNTNMNSNMTTNMNMNLNSNLNMGSCNNSIHNCPGKVATRSADWQTIAPPNKQQQQQQQQQQLQLQSQNINNNLQISSILSQQNQFKLTSMPDWSQILSSAKINQNHMTTTTTQTATPTTIPTAIATVSNGLLLAPISSSSSSPSSAATTTNIIDNNLNININNSNSNNSSNNNNSNNNNININTNNNLLNNSGANHNHINSNNNSCGLLSASISTTSPSLSSSSSSSLAAATAASSSTSSSSIIGVGGGVNIVNGNNINNNNNVNSNINVGLNLCGVNNINNSIANRQLCDNFNGITLNELASSQNSLGLSIGAVLVDTNPANSSTSLVDGVVNAATAAAVAAAAAAAAATSVSSNSSVSSINNNNNNNNNNSTTASLFGGSHPSSILSILTNNNNNNNSCNNNLNDNDDHDNSFSKNGTEILDFEPNSSSSNLNTCDSCNNNNSNNNNNGNINTNNTLTVPNHLQLPQIQYSDILMGNCDHSDLNRWSLDSKMSALKTRRSNSLTTQTLSSTSSSNSSVITVNDNCSNSTENLAQFANKPRSFSLSIETQHNGLTNSGSDTRLDDFKRSYMKFQTCNVGMSGMGFWLKSLRLHKYMDLFKDMTYEEMLNITEEFLQSVGVTKGASHKLALCIEKLKDRPNQLLRIEQRLHTGQIRLKEAIEEMANIVLTPMKPIEAVNHATGEENVALMFLNCVDLVYSKIQNDPYAGQNDDTLSVLLWILDRCIHNEAFVNQGNQLKELKLKLSKYKINVTTSKLHHAKNANACNLNKSRWTSKNRKLDAKNSSNDRINYRKNSTDLMSFPLSCLQQQHQQQQHQQHQHQHQQQQQQQHHHHNHQQHNDYQQHQHQQTQQHHHHHQQQQQQQQQQAYQQNQFKNNYGNFNQQIKQMSHQHHQQHQQQQQQQQQQNKVKHHQQQQQQIQPQMLQQQSHFPSLPQQQHRRSLNNLIVVSGGPQQPQKMIFKPGQGMMPANPANSSSTDNLQMDLALKQHQQRKASLNGLILPSTMTTFNETPLQEIKQQLQQQHQQQQQQQQQQQSSSTSSLTFLNTNNNNNNNLSSSSSSVTTSGNNSSNAPKKTMAAVVMENLAKFDQQFTLF